MGRPKGSKNKTTKTTSSGTSRTGKNTSGRSRTTSGRKTGSSARSSRSAGKGKQDVLMGDEIAVICSIALAIFLLLSNLGLCGMIGDLVRNLQLGLLGTVGYLFPLMLVVIVIFILSNRQNPYASLKMTAALIAMIFLSALIQLTLGGGTAAGSLTAYFRQAAETGLGGGVVGGALAQLLYGLTGQAGAVLIILVAVFICLVYITEKPLARMLAKGSVQVAGRAKEDLDRMAVEARHRAEERRRYRMEQKALGVNLEATDLSAAEEMIPQAVDAEEAVYREEQPDSIDALEADEIEEKPVEEDPLSYYEENEEDPYSRFTGRILPDDYDYDADDSVPFEEEDLFLPENQMDDPYPEEDQATMIPQESEDESAGVVQNDVEAESVSLPDEEMIHALHAQDKDMFGQEAGSRQITTASGRIIDSDVESLHKRVEKKRSEAASEEDNAAVQAEIEKKKPKKPYRYPSVTLLKRGARQNSFSNDEIKDTAIKLQTTLKSFGVGVTVTDVSVGPAVTRYELHPEQGVKVSRIVSLADDIKLSLAASDIRIEAPIPGKSAVGIEVPNKENNIVYLGDILGSREFQDASSRLSFGVGKDIGGKTVVTDLAKMPHLLIAGATGSGKSVCINTLIMSLIYKASPEEVRLIMIDPKVVELQIYNGIPHLLIPVVTDPKKASAALNWAVAEMTERYKKFAEIGVRDLKGYNQRVEKLNADPEIPEEKKPEKMPQIVIIVDELADLMMVAPGEVEDAICRLAQLARAAGIHLVIATQRPSVNVITGLIKANVPSRVAFAVSSGVDSRTIIDMNGAEKLLGKGDMLFYPSGIPKPVRVQGAFVSDAEVQAVVDFLTEQGEAEYSELVQNQLAQPSTGNGSSGHDDRDELFRQAGIFIIESDKASIGMLQRKFRIGFNRAARIMDQLAEAQVVGPEEGTKPRKIIMTMEEFNEI